MPPPQARTLAALPDELIEEVLVRVPPDDPVILVRAALACRHWCRLLADPAFRRRRLDVTPPPMLGFLCDCIWAGSLHPSARFFPTSSFRPPQADLRRLRSLDARHGRVLFHSCASRAFLVWDPITDQRVELPNPPWYLRKKGRKATVLCAATGTGVCDHLNCQRGPFAVVLLGTSKTAVVGTKNLFSCIYSSESGAWSKPTYHDHGGNDLEVRERSALVGNTLFFALCNYDSILEYDLGTQQMSMIRLPSVRRTYGFPRFVPIELTTLEDGRLGFARVENYSDLCLWSRGEGDDDVKGWTLCKVIDLKNLFLPDDWFLRRDYYLVGFAERVCVAFVAVEDVLFTIDMKSGLMKKVFDGRPICCIVPFINFCNPALEAPSRDDGQTVGISSGKAGRLKRLKR